MLIFISGGVRSGKSTLGEQLASALAVSRKVYLATAQYSDEEMQQRIEKHQQSRVLKGFTTIEKSVNIAEATFYKDDTVVLDCLGMLTSNELFADYTHDITIAFRKRITGKLVQDILNVYARVQHLIIISNEVFSDGVLYDWATMQYMEALGAMHVRLVHAADHAIECVCGVHINHKGELR